jgi:hypothetical protein
MRKKREMRKKEGRGGAGTKVVHRADVLEIDGMPAVAPGTSVLCRAPITHPRGNPGAPNNIYGALVNQLRSDRIQSFLASRSLIHSLHLSVEDDTEMKAVC